MYQWLATMKIDENNWKLGDSLIGYYGLPFTSFHAGQLSDSFITSPSSIHSQSINGYKIGRWVKSDCYQKMDSISES